MMQPPTDVSRTDSSVAWIVLVTRHYHWLVKPYIELWDRHVGLPLVFFSDRLMPDLPPHHKCMVAFPENRNIYLEPCGSEFKQALERVDAPLVTMLLPDIMPQGFIDHTRLNSLIRFMGSGEKVARGNLYDGGHDGIVNGIAQEDPSAVLHDENGMKIIRISPTNQHIGQLGSTSGMPALWSRKFLLEFVEDGWALDALELPGQHKFAKQGEWFSVCTTPSLLEVCHLCYTRDKRAVELTSVKDEKDRELISKYIPSGFRVVP